MVSLPTTSRASSKALSYCSQKVRCDFRVFLCSLSLSLSLPLLIASSRHAFVSNQVAPTIAHSRLTHSPHLLDPSSPTNASAGPTHVLKINVPSDVDRERFFRPLLANAAIPPISHHHQQVEKDTESPMTTRAGSRRKRKQQPLEVLPVVPAAARQLSVAEKVTCLFLLLTW